MFNCCTCHQQRHGSSSSLAHSFYQRCETGWTSRPSVQCEGCSLFQVNLKVDHRTRAVLRYLSKPYLSFVGLVHATLYLHIYPDKFRILGILFALHTSTHQDFCSLPCWCTQTERLSHTHCGLLFADLPCHRRCHTSESRSIIDNGDSFSGKLDFFP